MATALHAAPLQSPRKRRRWRLILAILFGLAVFATAFILVLVYIAGRDLRAAIAEADRLDPGWRLEELEAKRADVPEAQNAAHVVLNALALLPPEWSPWRATGTPANIVFKRSFTFTPAEQLAAQEMQDLQSALVHGRAALSELRKVTDLPNGRYVADFPADGGISTFQQPRHVSVREAVALLWCDLLVCAQEGDADGALASCRAILNVARSFGDEPMWFSQLVRMEIRSDTCGRIERVLAQGRPLEAALAAAQRLLEQEEVEPLFLIAARGQRAGWYRMLESLRTGDLPDIGAGVKSTFLSTASYSSRPALLYLNTRLVEIAKLPVEQQLQRLKEEAPFARQRLSDYPPLARVYFIPRVEKNTTDLSRGQARSQAQLRCAIAALAAERYRQAQGHWPSSLSILVPDYLSNVPVDPFDGQPLRLRSQEQGLMIYSVGLDRQDNDGKINRANPDAPGTDIGLQLWDEPQRRQPPHSTRPDNN